MSTKRTRYENFYINVDNIPNKVYYDAWEDKIVVSRNIFTLLTKKELRTTLYHERGHQIHRKIDLFLLTFLVLLAVSSVFFKIIVLFVPSAFLLIGALWWREIAADRYSISSENSIDDLCSTIAKLTKLKSFNRIKHMIDHPPLAVRLWLSGH